AGRRQPNMAEHRPFLPDSWRDLARLVLIAGTSGAAIALIFWLPSRDSSLFVQLALGAWVGSCIYAASMLLMLLVGARLNQLAGIPFRLALGGVFFTAGVLGWALA